MSPPVASMSPTCGVCCVFVCFTVLCFLPSAEAQTNCVSCSYNLAGDGTIDYACVNDSLSHATRTIIPCDFTTYSCVIKAVYRFEGYQELQSVTRNCLPTSATSSEVCGYTDKRTCLLECKTNMCNAESNADLAKIYISSSGNLSNSVPATIVLQLVTCLSILSITLI